MRAVRATLGERGGVSPPVVSKTDRGPTPPRSPKHAHVSDKDSSEVPPQTTRSRLIVLPNHPCVPLASVCEAVFKETLRTRMQEDHTDQEEV